MTRTNSIKPTLVLFPILKPNYLGASRREKTLTLRKNFAGSNFP
jgi:hypothetical protein